MNTANALGFFLLGTVMQVLPRIGGGTPGDVESAQTLWLQVMSLVTGGIGGGYLLRMGLQEASTMLSRLSLRRAEAREQAAAQVTPQTMPLGVRVTF
jgi:hypothetical protein